MQSLNPKFAAISVGIPILMVSVQPKVCNAMHVEAITTTQCYASKGDTGKTTSSAEALSPTNTASAVDVTPAAPHAGTDAKVIACIVIPGPLPTAPHIALPMVHHPSTLHVPKGTVHLLMAK